MTGDEIATLRGSLSLTQVQLAQLLGVHPLTVSKWERGVVTPPAHEAALLDTFAKAAKRKPDVGVVVVAALVGAGIGFALFQILDAAFTEAPIRHPARRHRRRGNP